MKAFKSTLLGTATAIGLALAVTAPAKADLIQLGFILDSSGSIGSTGWNTIRNGLANAINNLIPVGGADTYEISVVTFDDAVGQTISNVLVNSVAARTNLANQIAALSFQGGLTNYAAAFTAMSNILDNTAGAAFTYVNFATDGEPNVGGDGVTQRNAMIAAASVDNISIEGIGGGVNQAFLTGSICYPQPCDTTDPYNFPTQGFYIGVADANAYVDAIENKIRIVTNQVPEPATLLLLGAGLIGLGVVRYRKS